VCFQWCSNDFATFLYNTSTYSHNNSKNKNKIYIAYEKKNKKKQKTARLTISRFNPTELRFIFRTKLDFENKRGNIIMVIVTGKNYIQTYVIT
jgi:hypothetical protein